MRYTRLITILAILALFGLVGTAVFVYLPGDISITPVQPPVIFDAGTNANQTGLAGNTITLILGENSSSFSLTLHPTYQKTYFHDVLRIVNPALPAGDNYFFGIKVLTPVSGPYTTAQMNIYDSSNNLVLSVDLTSATLQGWPTALNDNTVYRVDFVFVLPENVPLPGSTTIQVELVYSPQSATIPP